MSAADSLVGDLVQAVGLGFAAAGLWTFSVWMLTPWPRRCWAWLRGLVLDTRDELASWLVNDDDWTISDHEAEAYRRAQLECLARMEQPRNAPFVLIKGLHRDQQKEIV